MPPHSVAFSKETTTLDRSTVAIDMFIKGYNCAQSILFAFRDESGVPEETALKISCGFGAGMGRNGEVCGAVSGGIMVLGMRHGWVTNDDRTDKETTYFKIQELMNQFALKHGSCKCRDLLNGCDLTTEEGMNSFKENDYLTKVCNKCVQSVVEILEQI
jgi:C_GCAxxG_C_C family probable redox protein